MTMNPVTADQLLYAAQQGDHTALDRLLAIHQKTVFRYGLRYCKTTEDAEDAVQETLWAATRFIGGFRRASAITTWLFTIVRNKCFRLRRYHATDSDLATVLPFVPDSVASPEGEIAAEQVRIMLTNALAQLHPLQREVILARDVEGLTAPEAAERLGITIQALKSRLHRARTQLRSLLVERKYVTH
ncbi:MAG TPA: RNA polymerase sigma factor [Steroidobacteraceae bacterium]|nr:RNA polymerase sigma factor [Steroidobacteraceae bacterium]